MVNKDELISTKMGKSSFVYLRKSSFVYFDTYILKNNPKQVNANVASRTEDASTPDLLLRREGVVMRNLTSLEEVVMRNLTSLEEASFGKG